MENQLVVICQEYSLDEQREKILVEKFSDMVEISQKWSNTIMQLSEKTDFDKKDIAEAKEARIILKKKRTEIESTRKILKEDFLRGGQAVDKIAKYLTSLIEPTEKMALDIEKSEEIKEQKRKIELSEKRINLIHENQLSEFIPVNLNFGEMEEIVFTNLFEGAKLQKNAKIEAEKKAEADRIAKEQADKAEQERIKKENEKLKADADLKAKKITERNSELRPYIVLIRDYNKVLNLSDDDFAKEVENLKLAYKLEQEYKAKEAEKQAKEAQEQADKQAKLTEQANKDKAEKLRLQKEIDDKKAAEILAENNRIKTEKKAASAPDKAKLLTLSETFKYVKMPEVKSDDAKSILQQIEIMQTKMVNYIIEKSNTI